LIIRLLMTYAVKASILLLSFTDKVEAEIRVAQEQSL
jgi:hypothetical protein